jgi:hypothetical protein
VARSQGAEPGPAADAGFAERLLEVIDSGRRTATYKLALLIALLDLCARRSDAAGRPPGVLYTREIAEQVAAIYWPQVIVSRRGPSRPDQHSEFVSLVAADQSWAVSMKPLATYWQPLSLTHRSTAGPLA